MALTETELLKKVKAALGTNSYSDEAIKIHIADVVDYMKRAGVAESIALSDASVGVIIRGVADLWNLDSGGVGFSPYFRDRVTQLALSGSDEIASS